MAAFRRPPDNVDFSSSPAFATPLHPVLPVNATRPPPPLILKPTTPAILPIILPPPTLRPLAFRTFTKKHNLTLSSSALQALASFIGRNCGSGWREEGTGEKVLDEVAKLWKAGVGPVIVDDGDRLSRILKTLDGSMSGGKIGAIRKTSSLSREGSSFSFGSDSAVDVSEDFTRPGLDSNRSSSFGLSKLRVEELDEQDDAISDPRAWVKVVTAFDQPRFSYNVDKKHFEQSTSKPSLFPSPSRKSALFKERYNIIYQRLLRNEAFQTPTFNAGVSRLTRSDTATAQQFYKITPIANLLGRGGSSHLLLGMLTIAPTGMLALNDPTGSILLNLQHAQHLRGEDSAFVCPGMIILIDGVYEEEWSGAGSGGLGDSGGVGGTIGGRFVGFSLSGPPVEKRNVSLGFNLNAGDVGAGFGWTDFLGLGSEKAVGNKMRRLEQRLIGPESETCSTARRKAVVLSDLTLDQPQALSALRKVLEHYAAAADAPMVFILMGNFCSRAAVAGGSVGSIEYKELFNELAAVLADFPALLRNSTWVFVPGDNDPWSSAFSAGASALIPKATVPDVFTNRIKRAFAVAKSSALPSQKGALDGEAVWTSNPARVSLFGPAHEVVIFRDDASARFRRTAVRIGQATLREPDNSDAMIDAVIEQDSGAIIPEAATTHEPVEILDGEAMALDKPIAQVANSSDEYTVSQAKKLILSLLPQSSLSPVPLSVRPVHWDYASSALSLYPLPHTLILADAGSDAFAVTFEGCHVINPGCLVSGGGRRKEVNWIEYDCWSKKGIIMKDWIG